MKYFEVGCCTFEIFQGGVLYVGNSLLGCVARLKYSLLHESVLYLLSVAFPLVEEALTKDRMGGN